MRFRKMIALGSLTTALGMAGLRVAGAAPVSVFGTGLDASGNLAVPGSVDTHYTLVSSPDTSFPGPSAFVANPVAVGWLADGPHSQWDSITANGNTFVALGDYDYRTTFDLTGLDPATADLTGLWATDNTGVDILINGVSTGDTNTAGFDSLSAFQVTSGFVSGLNTLDFVVDNTLDTHGNNPTGLRVELSGTASPISTSAVPLPRAAWMGLVTLAGWAGFGALRSRRANRINVLS